MINPNDPQLQNFNQSFPQCHLGAIFSETARVTGQSRAVRNYTELANSPESGHGTLYSIISIFKYIMLYYIILYYKYIYIYMYTYAIFR